MLIPASDIFADLHIYNPKGQDTVNVFTIRQYTDVVVSILANILTKIWLTFPTVYKRSCLTDCTKTKQKQIFFSCCVIRPMAGSSELPRGRFSRITRSYGRSCSSCWTSCCTTREFISSGSLQARMPTATNWIYGCQILKVFHSSGSGCVCTFQVREDRGVEKGAGWAAMIGLGDRKKWRLRHYRPSGKSRIAA